LGIYQKSTGGFLGVREKFGSKYIFEEEHREKGTSYGTVTPYMELPEFLPESILLVESLPPTCESCGGLVGYSKYKAGADRGWIHLEEDCGSEVIAIATRNKPLFDWLLIMEGKYLGSVDI
jgi:hypothetical protein